MRNVKRLFCCAALTVGLGAVGFGNRVQAAEFGANTPYYEDDGLLDIPEWFDGNDYNPTDEAWWRWDDDTYNAIEDVSGDENSDGWYGYTARDDNDWYYDYYDPTPYSYYDYDQNDLYDYSSRYYDYDNDGIYDAFASYTDTDGDGLYDDFDYYSFSDTGTDTQKQQAQKQQAQSQGSKQSRQQTVSGKIEKTKLVKVRGGKQHIVVAFKPQQQQAQQQQGQSQMVIADLGNAQDLKNVNPKLGDKITVKGPKAQVGKQQVILAKSVELNGQTTQINRDPRSITGKVVNTHKIKVRGKQHLMAMVEAKQKDKTRKIAVDLGPADQLKMDIKKGSSVTFSGFPVRVKDKPLVLAQSIQQGDQQVQINRQSQTGGQQQQGQQQGQRSQQSGAQQAAAQQTGQRSQDYATSVEELTKDWPQDSKKAATKMQEQYGQPTGMTPNRIVWLNKGPWKEIIVIRDPIQHDFPMPHKDVLEQVINYEVPPDKFDDLAEFDGSVVAERTRGTLSARCDKEAANFLALNLADEIIKGSKSVEEARQAYAQNIKQMLSGQKPQIMQKLQFNPPQQAGDTDVAVMQKPQGQQGEAQPAGERQQ